MYLRIAILACLIGVTTVQAMAATHPKVILEVVIQVMRQCYEVKQQMGAQLAQCMGQVFEKIPNPEQYKIYLDGDIPGEAKLLIYNQAGYQIHCELFTGKTLIVKQCLDYEGNPLTKGQSLSITPPQN
ncbi:hypothetical protein [Legionella clemsonensis]|uniref:Uncharacterized protein n=1 Tax=Legionella clemsonensis TaxID=1867846 RepID=A0A222P2T5_9GAMM|nr:hypothetical protein [Legionella clemsonensis]ASQ46168.1 hypothetical protein clem_08080 [Legionella clemsonensis]